MALGVKLGKAAHHSRARRLVRPRGGEDASL
jgi:hypothetical protein